MTYKKVFDALNGITVSTSTTDTIPVAYYAFPEDDPNNPPPSPPFICYYYPGSNDLDADNANYQMIRPLTVELYTDNKDFSVERQVETALNNAGFVYTRDETYIDSEKLYLVSYETEVVISNG